MINEIRFKSELDEELKKENLLVLDFYADWCGPCKSLSPILDELDKEYPNVDFLKINVNNLDLFPEEYKVSSLPTIFFIKGGKKLHSIIGFNEDELIEKINQFSK